MIVMTDLKIQPGDAAQANPSGTTGTKEDAQKNRDLAALSYVWILSVIVYFAKRDSPFVRFHARQGIALFLLSIVVWMIPWIGRLLELVVLALAILGFLGAAQGQWKELPLIGPLARRDSASMRRNWREIVDGVLRRWSTAKRDMRPETSDMRKENIPSSGPATPPSPLQP